MTPSALLTKHFCRPAGVRAEGDRPGFLAVSGAATSHGGVWIKGGGGPSPSDGFAAAVTASGPATADVLEGRGRRRGPCRGRRPFAGPSSARQASKTARVNCLALEPSPRRFISFDLREKTDSSRTDFSLMLLVSISGGKVSRQLRVASRPHSFASVSRSGVSGPGAAGAPRAP